MNSLYMMDAEKALSLIDSDSVQSIYIDPPYNTYSKLFEYDDCHNDWEGFLFSKLEKAKKVLKDTGVIFISIDDAKLVELRLICNEIFGKDNFLGTLITRQATRSNAKHINTIHEYVIVYAKNKNKAPRFQVKRLDIPYYNQIITPLINEVKKNFKTKGKKEAENLLKFELKKISALEGFSWIKNYNIIDDDGEICFATDLSVPSKSPKELFIPEINLFLPALKYRGWVSKDRIVRLHNENRLLFKNNRPYQKNLLSQSKDSAMSILNFYSRQGKHDLEKIGMGGLFSTAKPVELIKLLIKISSYRGDDIVLDFFAGSGTTAQAVIECNQEDGTNKKFVLCQTAEAIKNNKLASNTLQKNGYDNNIANLTRLRLEKLKEIYSFDYRIVY